VSANSTQVIHDGVISRHQHQKLVQNILRRTPEQGVQDSPIPQVSLIRTDSPSSCTSSIYEPSLGFIIQGSKTIQLGDREIVYDELSYLATCVSLPVLGQVMQASDDKPYLAIKLALNPQEIADLLLQMHGQNEPSMEEEHCPLVTCGLQVAHMDHALLDSIARLVALLDTPKDIAVIGPLIRREILYRVLMGELGPRIRKFALVDHQASRVSKVIALLKDRFSEPLRVRDLADAVNMSESALFRSFKEVTRMSPVQFQKRLRLYEARRLMMAEGLEAATASFRVGYESPSHFSREYSRLFGASPRSDVVRQRGDNRERAV